MATGPGSRQRSLQGCRTLTGVERRRALADQRPALFMLASKRNDWTASHEQLKQFVVKSGRRPQITIGKGPSHQAGQPRDRQVTVNPDIARPGRSGDSSPDALMVRASVNEPELRPIVQRKTTEPSSDSSQELLQPLRGISAANQHQVPPFTVRQDLIVGAKERFGDTAIHNVEASPVQPPPSDGKVMCSVDRHASRVPEPACHKPP